MLSRTDTASQQIETNRASERDIKQAAYAWASQGYIVHFADQQTKAPHLKGWQTNEVVLTWADINRQYRPGCNLGILTGSRNRNLVVIDFDDAALYDIFCTRFPQFVDTRTVTTRRGQHVYFHTDILPETTKIPGQVELLADATTGGGFNVIVPPSVHASGHRYTSNGKPILHISNLADVVAWIESLKPEKPLPPRPQQTPGTVISGPMNERARDAYMQKLTASKAGEVAGALEGTRNSTLYESAKVVFAHCDNCGYDRTEARKAFESAGATSGLSEHEIHTTLNSAWSSADGRRVNTPDFALHVPDEPGNPYTRPDSGYAKAQGAPIPDFADVIFDAAFVNQASNLPATGVVCVIADKGTGKTEWAKDMVNFYCETLPDTRVMVTTPFITLTQAAHERYPMTENYLALDSVDQTRAKSIAITLNSLEHFAQVGNVPFYSVVVLDELTKILNALGSRKLFTGGQATRVYSVLRRVIERAELVLVTDADLTAVEVEWLKSIRPDVTVCYNTHRRDYGSMTVIDHEKPGALDTALFNAIGEDRGPVFAVSDSKSQVEAWHEEAVRVFGEDAVLCIHSGNSTNTRQREFVKNPDQIANLRAVFCSPSVMTGLDIQQPVYQTFGSFNNHDVDAPGCLQLVARARNTGYTTVWIRRVDRKRPTDPDTIYQHARNAAKGSETLCGLDDQGALDFDGITRELNLLLAQVKARYNHSLNDLWTDFVALAGRSYTVTIVTDDLPDGMGKPLHEARERVKDRETELRLTVDPITPEEHQRRSGLGIRTEADNAALYRWQAEHFYKQTLTGDLLAFDREGKGRDETRLFMDVLRTSEADLRALDAGQIADHTPDLMRGNYARRQRVLRLFILAGWGSRSDFTPEVVRTESEWLARFEPFFEKYGASVYLYCGGRRDHQDNAWNTAKRLLRLMGLNFEDTRTKSADGEKQYRLGREKWQRMNRLADVRAAGLERERSLAEGASWTKLQKTVVTIYPAHEKLLIQTLSEGVLNG